MDALKYAEEIFVVFFTQPSGQDPKKLKTLLFLVEQNFWENFGELSFI